MFVGSTFLGSADRLSVKSVSTNKTGSCLGLIGSVAFIVICFILFIGPVIFYFKGDYIQGVFTTWKAQNLKMYSGCDFKLAISIYSKATGQIINLNTIKQLIKTQILYVSPDQDTFFASVEPCYPQYFAEMDQKPHQFKPEDCYIIPNGLGYFSQVLSGFISVIGMKFKPICDNPFLCTYGSQVNSQNIARRLQFFGNHYMVLRFTGNYLDELGNLKKKFYEMYSSSWESPDMLISQMWAVLQTSRVYLDNSVMPWINNNTILYTNWLGQEKGRPLSTFTLESSGVGAYFVTTTTQNVFFRQYKKLDWLLGMLGGGILLVFIIFWTACNFVSTTKQKYQTCQTTTLLRYNNQNANDLYKPSFSYLWFVSNILPFKLPFFAKQNKILYTSEKMLDIADLIKKLKTTTKNLKKQNCLCDFQSKILQICDQPKNQTFSQEQIKYQLRNQVLQELKGNSEISKIYEHHLPMLALCNDQQNQSIKKNIQILMKDEIYSKIKVPKFQQKQKSKLARFCKTTGQILQKFITLFDVFGAKPNLNGGSQSFSIFGCILTLVIMTLAILTFALTLKNMGITRTYWDQIYTSPQKLKVSMISGQDFKLGFCFNPYAFTNNLVIGQDKIVNIKFYQYTRNGTSEEYKYFDMIPIRADSNKYFETTSSQYSTLSQSSCFRPDNGLRLQVYGDAQSEMQAYIGVKMTPYCSGTPASCSAIRNQTIAKFYNLINVYPIYLYVPEARYFPDIKKVAINPFTIAFAQAVNQVNLNFTKSIDQIINMDTLQVIDDWASWTMGGNPSPRQQILTTSPDTYQSILDTTDASEVYYNMKMSITGRVSRVIFSSYKVDFLFATIGGCFAFFFFFFGCFGKMYNSYCMKVKLAEKLYNQDPQGISGFKAFLKWMRIPCCKDQIIQKIQRDIDCVNLAKNVDNVYRLSVSKYDSLLEKNLGLIYLKQRIKQDETVIIQQQKQEELIQDDDFQLDWDASLRKQKRRLNPHHIQNISKTEQDQQIALQKQYGQIRKNIDQETTLEPMPTAKSVEKCGSLISDFDIFHSNAQLTLDGKRSVKSICGGLCCIILFIFICILTSHFLTIYFSDFHRVSLNKVTDQNSNSTRIDLQVGKNFKLAVSFFKQSQYNFIDVRNQRAGIGLSLIKYKVQRKNGGVITTETQTINLDQCGPGYIKGYVNEHQDPKYYQNISFAYCVPDGTQLSLYGSANDKVREYFSIKMYNKFGNASAVGLQNIKTFLSSYLPLYHISSPMIDLRADGDIRYSLRSIIRSSLPQVLTSRSYNISIIKTLVKYDTAVNPSSQRPSFDSYKVRPPRNNQYFNGFVDNVDRFLELNFYSEDFYNQYVIKKTKVNQIFGIVGGCIALLFFGLGAFPRSYNEYKLRYNIGTKLYIIMGKKRQMKIRNNKGRPAQIKHSADQLSPQLSQFKLFLAWILSFWGYFKSNYNSNDTLRFASLIQSKVGKDLNIFQFLKTLRVCESGIKKMGINQASNLNLCRLFTKQIVLINAQQQNQNGKQLVKTIRSDYNELIQAAKVNKFTQWELNILIKARQNNVDISKIFNQKWLDKFMGINRSSIAASTSMRPSSQNRLTSFKRSMLPEGDKNSSLSNIKSNDEGLERSQNIIQE